MFGWTRQVISRHALSIDVKQDSPWHEWWGLNDCAGRRSWIAMLVFFDDFFSPKPQQ